MLRKKDEVLQKIFKIVKTKLDLNVKTKEKKEI